MSDTTDHAIDVADKWAQSIAQKISEAAPDAQEIATEAIKVKIGSTVLSWVCLAIFSMCALWVLRWLFQSYQKAANDPRRYNNDEEVPYFIGSVLCGLVAIFCLLGCIATFPSREIMGVFSPRGYTALLLLDAVTSKR